MQSGLDHKFDSLESLLCLAGLNFHLNSDVSHKGWSIQKPMVQVRLQVNFDAAKQSCEECKQSRPLKTRQSRLKAKCCKHHAFFILKQKSFIKKKLRNCC